MIISARLIAAATPTAARSMRRWIVHLGGLGLIPLGLLDNSPIPIPGSMDIVLMILCVRGQESWIYYALMAVAGSVIGGFVTYRLARKGGKGTLKRRFPPRQMEKINKLLRTMGVRCRGHPCFPAAAFPLHSISCCRGRHAISGKKIPGCARAWANSPIHAPGLPVRALWTKNNQVPLAPSPTLLTGRRRARRCHGIRGIPFSGAPPDAPSAPRFSSSSKNLLRVQYVIHALMRNSERSPSVEIVNSLFVRHL